jgi:hypothetical protein
VSDPTSGPLSTDVPAAVTSAGDQTRLRRLLWVIGGIDLLAFGAMSLPRSMLEAAHRGLGLGEFPREAIAEYLARSSSMLYGCCGVLLLFLSRDIVRYAPVLRCMAVCGWGAAGCLMVIDATAGLPWWWLVAEGLSCAGLWTLVWRWTPREDRQAQRD